MMPDSFVGASWGLDFRIAIGQVVALLYASI